MVVVEIEEMTCPGSGDRDLPILSYALARASVRASHAFIVRTELYPG